MPVGSMSTRSLDDVRNGIKIRREACKWMGREMWGALLGGLFGGGSAKRRLMRSVGRSAGERPLGTIHFSLALALIGTSII